MRTWLAGLRDPMFDMDEVYDTFVTEFRQQFTDTQAATHAQTSLDNLVMVYPDIDTYIRNFKKLGRRAGYTQAHPEAAHFFLKGLAREILGEVVQTPMPTNYAGLKTRAVKATKS